MSEAKPLGGRIFTLPFLFGVLILLIALFFLAKRFIYGLGPVTGMNDGFPWGLWIAFDVNVGTAFACGGYAMAILIYIFNKGEFSPLLKPAILTSMFGYILGGVSVGIDIGRYWQMYNIFLPKYMNIHSAMLEVALCIATYCLILVIEFSPAVLKRFKLKNIEQKLNRVLFVFVALGLLLPTMHQSSLGTLVVLAGSKLSPLWWTKLLPLLFLFSAILLGYAIVVFETSITSVAFHNQKELKLLNKISNIVVWLVPVFLIIRLQQVIAQGALDQIFQGDLIGNVFLIENILLIISLFFLVPSKNRKNPKTVFWGAFFVMLGTAMYRFNAYITGYSPAGGNWHYFPSTPEVMITLGIVTIEILGYLTLVKLFPVLALPTKKEKAA